MKRLVLKGGAAFGLGLLFAGSVAGSAQLVSEAASECGTTHRVRPGESLSAIAARHYGDPDAYRRLHAANKATVGANPDLIHAGMVLRVPCADASVPSVEAAQATPPAEAARQAPAGIRFTVPAHATRNFAERSRAVVGAAVLAERLGGARNDAPRIVDLRAPGALGAGAIEGAVTLPWDRWGAFAADGDALAEFLGSIGIGLERPVVIVPADPTFAALDEAARAYWLLRAAGAGDVAILDIGADPAWETHLPLTRLVSLPLGLPDKADAAPRIGRATDALPRTTAVVEASLLDHGTSREALAKMRVDVPLADLAVDTVGNFKSLDLAWGRMPVHLEDGEDGVAALAWFLLSEVAGIEAVDLLAASASGLPVRPDQRSASLDPARLPARLGPGTVSLRGQVGSASDPAPSIAEIDPRGSATGRNLATRPSAARGPVTLPGAPGVADSGTSGLRVGSSSPPPHGALPPQPFVMSITPLQQRPEPATVPPGLRRAPGERLLAPAAD